MSIVRARVAPGGRVVIPAAFRAALGLKEGDDVCLELAEDASEVRIVPEAIALRRAQALVARYVRTDASLVDELIAERRVEASRE